MTITYANQQIRVIVIRKANELHCFIFPDRFTLNTACDCKLNAALLDSAYSINQTEFHIKTKRVAPAHN